MYAVKSFVWSEDKFPELVVESDELLSSVTWQGVRFVRYKYVKRGDRYLLRMRADWADKLVREHPALFHAYGVYADYKPADQILGDLLLNTGLNKGECPKKTMGFFEKGSRWSLIAKLASFLNAHIVVKGNTLHICKWHVTLPDTVAVVDSVKRHEFYNRVIVTDKHRTVVREDADSIAEHGISEVVVRNDTKFPPEYVAERVLEEFREPKAGYTLVAEKLYPPGIITQYGRITRVRWRGGFFVLETERPYKTVDELIRALKHESEERVAQSLADAVAQSLPQEWTYDTDIARLIGETHSTTGKVLYVEALAGRHKVLETPPLRISLRRVKLVFRCWPKAIPEASSYDWEIKVWQSETKNRRSFVPVAGCSFTWRSQDWRAEEWNYFAMEVDVDYPWMLIELYARDTPYFLLDAIVVLDAHDKMCESTCQLFCQKGCQVACRYESRVPYPATECKYACRKGCQVCETCENEEQTTGCATCEAECETCQACETCQSVCQTSCEDECETSCQDTCEVSCMDACQLECQDACETTCQFDCESTCQHSCELCEETCEAACQSSCEVTCQSSCESMCEVACQDVCETSCKSTCESTCQSSCEASCQTSCQSSCQSDCETACRASCEVACQTCQACETTCQTACERACETCMICESQIRTCPFARRWW